MTNPRPSLPSLLTGPDGEPTEAARRMAAAVNNAVPVVAELVNRARAALESAAAHAAALEQTLNPTTSDDSRTTRPVRRGRAAQQSPYGPSNSRRR